MTEAEFEIFLDEASDCFLQADFELWASLVTLPFTMITATGPVVLSTLEELRDHFDRYIAAAAGLRLDLISRRQISLEGCDDGTFIGTYETELLSRGKRVAALYTASVLLHRRGGKWKMSTVLNARGNYDWLVIPHSRLDGSV